MDPRRVIMSLCSKSVPSLVTPILSLPSLSWVTEGDGNWLPPSCNIYIHTLSHVIVKDWKLQIFHTVSFTIKSNYSTNVFSKQNLNKDIKLTEGITYTHRHTYALRRTYIHTYIPHTH